MHPTTDVGGMGHLGIVIYLVKGSSPIYWCSKRMTQITLNTLDTEAVVLSAGAKHALALRNTLREFSVEFDDIPILFEDQEKLVEKCNAPRIVKTARTKFSNQAWMHVHDLVKNGEVKVVQVSTLDQRADGLTKPLVGKLFDNSDRFFFPAENAV